MKELITISIPIEALLIPTFTWNKGTILNFDSHNATGFTGNISNYINACITFLLYAIIVIYIFDNICIPWFTCYFICPSTFCNLIRIDRT